MEIKLYNPNFYESELFDGLREDDDEDEFENLLE